jgi:hypothetical protein
MDVRQAQTESEKDEHVVGEYLRPFLFVPTTRRTDPAQRRRERAREKKHVSRSLSLMWHSVNAAICAAEQQAQREKQRKKE